VASLVAADNPLAPTIVPWWSWPEESVEEVSAAVGEVLEGVGVSLSARAWLGGNWRRSGRMWRCDLVDEAIERVPRWGAADGKPRRVK